MQPDSDCLVVGAGLVGSLAALALAELGWRVTVYERRARPAGERQSDVRALVLSASSVALLTQHGVWSQLGANTCAVREIQVTDSGGFGSVPLRAEEIGLDALGWSCPADQLLQACNAALMAHAGITVQWATTFTRAEAHGADTLNVSSESAAEHNLHTTRLVVGADGAQSAVREWASIGVKRLDYAQTAIVANVTASQPRAFTAFEHFTRGGPLALIPTGGAAYVSVQCLDGERAEDACTLDDSAYLELLKRRFGGRLGAFSQLGMRRSHPLVRQHAIALTAPRTVILGNAANTLHPNAAQGLNLGLRDVAALVASLRDTTATRDPGAPPSLATYALSRRRDHRFTGLFTDTLAQAFRSRLGGVACARRAAMLLTAHVTPLRRRLLGDLCGLGALADDYSRA